MIKKYTKKDGSTAYLFQAYLGTDPITGIQKRTTRRGFSSEREAKLAEARLLTEIEDNGLSLTTNNPTFEEVCNLWLETYETTVKESTYWKTKQILDKHIIPAFGKLKIKTITVTRVQKVLNIWSKKYTKYRTFLNYTSRVMKYAVNLSIINYNVCDRLIMPKAKPKIENHNFYTREQLKEFFKCWTKENNIMYHTFFRLLAYTGLRKSEALALTWNDVDLTSNSCSVTKTITIGKNDVVIVSDTPKTVKSIRTLDLDADTVTLLKSWRKKQRESYLILGFNTFRPGQLIFTNMENSFLHPGHVSNVLKRFITKYNLDPITPHGFRHTHCSLLLESGIPIKEVQYRLGHGDIKTTMNIYAHVTKKEKLDTGSQFAKFIG